MTLGGLTKTGGAPPPSSPDSTIGWRSGVFVQPKLLAVQTRELRDGEPPVQLKRSPQVLLPPPPVGPVQLKRLPQVLLPPPPPVGPVQSKRSPQVLLDGGKKRPRKPPYSKPPYSKPGVEVLVSLGVRSRNKPSARGPVVPTANV